MWGLEFAARRRGYSVINWGYPSIRDSVRGHSERLHRELTDRLRSEARRVHFVTHSMGGIILRQYLADASLPNVGRVVMLAPPNQGSEVADQLKDWWLFRRTTGPAGQELTTDATGPASLPTIPVELGIIAGSRATNPLFARWIDGANDGKVAVERTTLPGMKDFLVVPRGHTMLPWVPQVIRQTLHFLEVGTFQHQTAR